MKKINLFVVYFSEFIILEILYKLLIKQSIFRLSLINMFLFIGVVALFLTIITKLFKNTKINKTIYFILLTFLTIWFSAEYVIKGYFGFYISWNAFKIADQIGSFAGKGVIEVLKRIPGICLLFIPLILNIIFHKKIDYTKLTIKSSLIYIISFLILLGSYFLSLNINKNASYSPYVLTYEINDIALNVENLGVINTLCTDTYRTIFGFEDKIVINENNSNPSEEEPKIPEEEQPKVYEYNNLPIDFNSLMVNESNSAIKQIHEYMLNDPGTFQNEYTGYFKNKNLILFMAESFNEIAVKKELTPTLYKLIHEGFEFTNFYTPTIYSTIGGEFQELTGLYASSLDILSKFRGGNVSFPEGVATKFKENGYQTFAYHNNTYNFQNRDRYLKSLGFDYYKACNTGLEKLINCNEWPRSDVDMINTTFDEYINENHFMVFYATVSGHSGYTFASNAMARKHREEYQSFNYPYSEGPASYLAAQMELDQALEALITKLAKAGKLEDTVIALVGDHYPYELSVNEVNEISDFKRDATVTINKSNFILWNSEMPKVTISKVGSQIDVIPTIYNAFGLKYDSRLFIGKDILSPTEGLAMFSNRSWVTNKGTYFASSGKFVPNADVEIEDDYVRKMNQIVNNKITMSRLIINNNYYSKVFN